MSTATFGRACCAALLAAASLAALGPPPGRGAKAPKFVLARGKKGDRPGEFYSPIGIAVSRRTRSSSPT
jgi:hypothetical protein